MKTTVWYREIHLCCVCYPAEGRSIMPRFLCRAPGLWSPAETSGHSSLYLQQFSKSRSLCKHGFYFLFKPPTNSFPVPNTSSLPGWSVWRWPQEHQGTFSACYQKQGSYVEKSIIGHSFSCPSEWDNCTCVTASICKQCQSAEISPPMGFHPTKNTINSFWPNLPMM